ncbi:hypothetical protein [Vibrio sp. M260118]|uniref:hypothetical protein n=1 Tax=Vibrio sp. M260118 TaxID=3020896 RepID=UPI002F3F1BD0
MITKPPRPRTHAFNQQHKEWIQQSDTSVLSKMHDLGVHINKAILNGFFWTLSKSKQRAVIEMIASHTNTPKKQVRTLLDSKKPTEKQQAL